MKAPTMQQFNDWTEQDKIWWVEYELGGRKGSAITPGFIFYSNEGYGIKFDHDSKKAIKNPVAIPLSEAKKQYQNAKIAVAGIVNRN